VTCSPILACALGARVAARKKWASGCWIRLEPPARMKATRINPPAVSRNICNVYTRAKNLRHTSSYAVTKHDCAAQRRCMRNTCTAFAIAAGRRQARANRPMCISSTTAHHWQGVIKTPIRAILSGQIRISVVQTIVIDANMHSISCPPTGPCCLHIDHAHVPMRVHVIRISNAWWIDIICRGGHGCRRLGRTSEWRECRSLGRSS
jgi:hypothetical protein